MTDTANIPQATRRGNAYHCAACGEELVVHGPRPGWSQCIACGLDQQRGESEGER